MYSFSRSKLALAANNPGRVYLGPLASLYGIAVRSITSSERSGLMIISSTAGGTGCLEFLPRRNMLRLTLLDRSEEARVIAGVDETFEPGIETALPV